MARSIYFKDTFYKTIKNLKSFIKPFFLDVHKNIMIEIHKDITDSVKCTINYGRYILQFIEYVESMSEFDKDYTICLSILDLEKYGKVNDNLMQLKIGESDSKSVAIKTKHWWLPIEKQTELPDTESVPFVNTGKMSKENKDFFTKLYKDCKQKENLISLTNTDIYERISDFLFRIEDNTTEFKFSIAVDDLKFINTVLDGEELLYANVPKYHVFKDRLHTLNILKYKNDDIQKGVCNRKHDIRNNILNAVVMEVKPLQDLISVLSVSGIKVCGIVLGKNSGILSEGNFSPIESNVRRSIINQEFLISLKELSIILKGYKEDTISFVSGKDFVIINKKFVLLMRSPFNNAQ